MTRVSQAPSLVVGVNRGPSKRRWGRLDWRRLVRLNYVGLSSEMVVHPRVLTLLEPVIMADASAPPAHMLPHSGQHPLVLGWEAS